MFIAHFGLGFAAKKISHIPSLGTTFLAAQFIDLLWPFFLLLGLERVEIDPGNTVSTPLNFVSYPYSHSLVAVFCWAFLFGMVYFFIKKNLKAAIVLSLLVITHWVLDFLVHRPDLPLTFSENTKLGLGLWNAKVVSLIIELLFFITGVALYLSCTTPKNQTGRYGFWALVFFFLLIYFMNMFGDPPPDAKTIGYVGLAQWLFIFWAYWVDHHRVQKPG